MKKGAAPRLTRVQALACVPCKSEFVREETTNGLPRLTYPQPTGSLVTRLLAAFGRDPAQAFTRTLELDAMGAVVWDLIDGRRPVREIIDRFAQAHDLDPAEAEGPVTAFLRELGHRGIIFLREGC